MQRDGKKVFRGLADLPKDSSEDTIINGCMVLESGAFRRVYGEGALYYMGRKDAEDTLPVLKEYLE